MADFESLGPLDLLILQSTSFCNIACEYCYLPDRDLAKRMSIDTFAKIIRNIASSDLVAHEPVLLWHAGEPLTVPLDWYQRASVILHDVESDRVRFIQSIQTNAVLLNDSWCEYFKAEDVRVGISIDGPEFIHNRSRLTRRGVGTHKSVMQGIDLLRKHDIPFRVIAVLTDYSLDYAAEIYEFLVDIGTSFVGFNVEESEGVNVSSTLNRDGTRARFAEFMRQLYGIQRDGRVVVREFANMRDTITNICAPGRPGAYKSASILRPFSILTVGHDGSATTFSPELLGTTANGYDSFVIGNIANQPLETLVESERYRRMLAEIKAGVVLCRNSCDYFALCGGGFPSNKVAENGTFVSAETDYCRTQIQAVVDIVLDQYEIEVGSPGHYARSASV